MHLSMHTALPLPVFLRLPLVAGDAQCPEIPQNVRIHWPFEGTHGSNMIDLSRGRSHGLLAYAALEPVPFQDDGSEVCHARSAFGPEPGIVIGQLLPLDASLSRV